MPMESLSVISASLRASKGSWSVAHFLSFSWERCKYPKFAILGKLEILIHCMYSMSFCTGTLEHLDLAGNTFCDQFADETSALAEFQIHGQWALKISLSAAPSVPYDNDP